MKKGNVTASGYIAIPWPTWLRQRQKDKTPSWMSTRAHTQTSRWPSLGLGLLAWLLLRLRAGHDVKGAKSKHRHVCSAINFIHHSIIITTGEPAFQTVTRSQDWRLSKILSVKPPLQAYLLTLEEISFSYVPSSYLTLLIYYTKHAHSYYEF